MPAKFQMIFVVVLLIAATAPQVDAVEQGAIGPGDTLKITVLGEADYPRQVIVEDDGRIALPLAKDIRVSGMTMSEAAVAIAQKLSKFIKNPDVTVELIQKARKLVTVSGQVRTPGVYPLERESRLMEVIGLAGGFLETADQSKVTVTRWDSPEPVKCDLLAFLAGSRPDANVVLQDGDVILVPEKTPTLGNVFVFGAVRQPGLAIQIREGMRVSQAISAAGGIIPETADPARAMVKRQGQDEPVQFELAKALAGDPTSDLLLQAGDTITIPTMEQIGTFTIVGAVANSGEFPVRPNMTVQKALAAAGGPRQGAKLTQVRLTRTDQAGNKQSVKIDLVRVADGKTQDVAVLPGDTLFVPERPPRQDMPRLIAVGVSLLALLLRN
ncbi:MAG: SLBB domain-containing protein [Armatimonadetes bacterium]|nr:SLBB domain-containing protein [Armatimonadota bacterium]